MYDCTTARPHDRTQPSHLFTSRSGDNQIRLCHGTYPTSHVLHTHALGTRVSNYTMLPLLPLPMLPPSLQSADPAAAHSATHTRHHAPRQKSLIRARWAAAHEHVLLIAASCCPEERHNAAAGDSYTVRDTPVPTQLGTWTNRRDERQVRRDTVPASHPAYRYCAVPTKPSLR